MAVAALPAAMDARLRRFAWTGVALALLAAFLWAVGPRAVASELAGANLRAYAPAPFAGLAALLAWAESQRRLHRAAGATASPGRFARAYAAGAAGKQVVPGGTAAGPAILGYAVGRETDFGFERDVAAVSAGKYLGAAGALVPALGGALALGAGVLFPTLAVVTVALGGCLWALRVSPGTARRVVYALAGATRATAGRLSGRVERALARERVAAGLDGVADALSAIAGDRVAVGTAFALTTLAWCCYGAALWFAAAAVGHPVSAAVALAVAPVGSVARLVPLPAGLGGVSAAVAGLLSAFGAPLAAATATALLYRVATDLVVVAAGTGALVRSGS